MKNFIEKNPALVLLIVPVFGVITLLGAGIQLSVMQGADEIGFAQMFKFIILCVIGISTIILPVAVLYGSIEEKRNEITKLSRRVLSARTGQRGESEHWQTDIDYVDDLDGDGVADDSLRRLGVVE